MPVKKAVVKSDGNFVRVGKHIISLDHLASVELPPDGDPANTLLLEMANGKVFTLTGEDTDAALAELGKCCDVKPEKVAKPA